MNLELLREIRISKKVTQTEMGAYLGYKSKSGYCNLETGVAKISTETANKIAAKLEMTNEQKLAVFLPD